MVYPAMALESRISEIRWNTFTNVYCFGFQEHPPSHDAAIGASLAYEDDQGCKGDDLAFRTSITSTGNGYLDLLGSAATLVYSQSQHQVSYSEWLLRLATSTLMYLSVA